MTDFKKRVGEKLKDVMGAENVVENATLPPKTHNKPNRVGGVAADQLKSVINRIEKLEDEKVNIAADIRDVYAEAKGSGFDVKAIRAIIKIRKIDAAELEEQEKILDVYKNALGMLSDTPLGEAALRAEGLA